MTGRLVDERTEARLVNVSELAQALGISRSRLYELKAEGRITRGVYRLGPRTTRYDIDEVLAGLREAQEGLSEAA
jgi:predicted DNA-binding transcriptional regulator AlpA